ncbi:guanine nucleotide-binding protein subunit gamma 2-like isoform X1 [Typha latifolia]|uniref:guanine nucleotide-binding protein subunit gamma 2-like isoform X1 n=1 Tax=Typha latifolia TaxID=4733 RepID=UPI003C2EE72E
MINKIKYIYIYIYKKNHQLNRKKIRVGKRAFEMTTRAEEPREGGGGGDGGGGGVLPRSVGFLGKHRLTAAISRLEQEIQALQGELNELETMEPSSAACKEVLLGMEGKPDALLPVGPEDASWDRWFRRVRSSHSRKWWTNKSSDFS